MIYKYETILSDHDLATTLILKPVGVEGGQPGTITVSLRNTDEPVDLTYTTAPEVIKGTTLCILSPQNETAHAHFFTAFRKKRINEGLEAVNGFLEGANVALQMLSPGQ